MYAYAQPPQQYVDQSYQYGNSGYAQQYYQPQQPPQPQLYTPQYEPIDTAYLQQQQQQSQMYSDLQPPPPSTYVRLVLCENSSSCTDPNCAKYHPYGKIIDGSYLGEQDINKNGDAVLHYNEDKVIVREDNVEGEYFVKYKDCSCCHGYIYGCNNSTCQELGQCCCSMADECDEDNSNNNDESVEYINENIPSEYTCTCCCGMCKECPNCPEGICKCTSNIVWYPESADCKCCEGYKYNCGNPLCHENGECLKCKKNN